jgi:hypothetical protein
LADELLHFNAIGFWQPPFSRWFSAIGNGRAFGLLGQGD